MLVSFDSELFELSEFLCLITIDECIYLLLRFDYNYDDYDYEIQFNACIVCMVVSITLGEWIHHDNDFDNDLIWWLICILLILNCLHGYVLITTVECVCYS